MKILTWIITCLFICIPYAGAVDIYVTVTGNDHYPGTVAQPKASLAAALQQARELRRLNDPSIKGGIHIILKGGTYFLDATVFIRPEDAGTADSPTLIEAAKGEIPVLSGGIVVKGWKPLKTALNGLPAIAKGKVWVTDLEEPFNFRQLWVNNRKAIRAKDNNGDSMHRILSWNHQTEQCWIPTPETPDLKQAAGLEMFIHQWWAIAMLRIKKIEMHGDSSLLSFYQPESRIQSAHPWPAPWESKESGNSAFYLTNALQLLDEPGEWYLDQKAQKLYYWPRTNENLSTATVIAPVLETLVTMSGTIDQPVSYVFFKGISFQHTGWLRPSRQGHVPLQSGMYLLDAYKLNVPGTPDKKGLENQAWVGRPAAAVEVTYTEHTGFESCRFEHLASTGLDYKRGNHNDLINGNLFRDIGGTGIQLGVYSDEAFEAHLPYHPADLREVCSHTQITNNLVTNVTNEDWGTLGISAGYVKDVTIAHNEVNEVSYSGISIGWGWTKTINVMSNNKILSNKIHHYAKHMYDVAGVYTLSAQPGSVIGENYIDSIYKAPYAHIPTHWFYLYTDEGTSYYTVKDNWCPSEKFLQNANGPNNVWQNNGPRVADSIKQTAGLEEAYKHMLSENIEQHNGEININ
ncbi:Right handed beta helix region [Chitinophaga sp. CF118]|uniref:right-handed parallel beta-helix repeat-containing protein n=1 Tax=Chitinophaga sp. CF118 TaxID=1884367 RepID=UPI0008EBB240|nr:right-handed parallel beta-helix repeat-containing protein [Chitinophaga sp. CF118]SFF00556.1 Right handed beta helix region [Chitinophaga sp. CF118]